MADMVAYPPLQMRHLVGWLLHPERSAGQFRPGDASCLFQGLQPGVAHEPVRAWRLRTGSWPVSTPAVCRQWRQVVKEAISGAQNELAVVSHPWLSSGFSRAQSLIMKHLYAVVVLSTA